MARVKPERAGKVPATKGIQWKVPAVVLALALIVPLMNVIPTLEGAFRDRPPGTEYLGFRWMIGDHVQYGNLARQAEAGRLFLENMFTTEPQRPSYILVYFNLCGWLMALTGLSFPWVWELLRVIFGFGLLVASWHFVGFFFEEHRQRLLAFVLIAFSGGLGFLADLVPEQILKRPGYGFLTDPAHFQWNWSTFGTMLVALWIAPLMLFVIASILLLYERPISPAVRNASIFALGPLIWFVHPHTGNAAYLAFGLLGLAPVFEALWNLNPIPWKKAIDSIKRVGPFILSFGVIFVYLRWATGDAVFAEGARAGGDWNPAYSVFWYPLTYGLLIPLAAFGMRWSAEMPERPRHLLFSWLASSFILSVNPLFAGVKYQFLIHLPLAIFAANGIKCLRERSTWAKRASQGLAGMLVGAGLLVHGPVTIVRDMIAPVSEPYAYVSRSELKAMQFLDEQPHGTVLCSYRPCSNIAYISGKKVFTGHWLLTLNQSQKQAELRAFFNPRTPVEAKRQFLGKHGIRYVYFGPSEQRMGRVDPALGLEVVYDHEGVIINRVP